MSDKINGAALDPLAQVELARAMAEVSGEEEHHPEEFYQVRPLDNSEEGEQKDRFLFDPQSLLKREEWNAYRRALRGLDELPSLERAGALTWEVRRAAEEKLLDALDELDARKSERKEKKR